MYIKMLMKDGLTHSIYILVPYLKPNFFSREVRFFLKNIILLNIIKGWKHGKIINRPK